MRSFKSVSTVITINVFTKNILLDVLMCAITEYFFKLCRILTSLLGESKHKQRMKILSDTTHQSVQWIIYYPTAFFFFFFLSFSVHFALSWLIKQVFYNTKYPTVQITAQHRRIFVPYFVQFDNSIHLFISLGYFVRYNCSIDQAVLHCTTGWA